MLIQQRVSLLLSLIVVMFAALSYPVLDALMAPAFEDLEQQAMRSNVERARQALATDLDRLSAATGDWAPWNLTYAFVQGHNEQFPENNLDAATLSNLDLNLALFYDASQELRWGMFLDGESGAARPLESLTFSETSWPMLFEHHSTRSQVNGAIATNHGTMLVSSRPVVRGNYQGSAAGTVIFGQFLDQARISAYRARFGMALDLWPIDGARSDRRELAQSVLAAPQMRVSHATDKERRDYGIVSDVAGAPLLVMELRAPRDITALGGQTQRATFTALAVLAGVVAAASWLLLRFLVISPLTKLTQHVEGLHESGDFSRRLDMRRADELGILASKFDLLVGELQTVRKELIETSFKAGMAETASGVLHNIRNAMTPLVNRLASAVSALKTARPPHLDKAILGLSDRTTEPARVEKLTEYALLATEQLHERLENVGSDLDVASKQARQVESILIGQETVALASPVLDSFELDRAVEEAASVLPEPGEEAVSVHFDETLSERLVRAHRIGLVQILSNLILNAYESIERGATPTGEIHVGSKASDDREFVRVTVKDNGAGIAPDALERIFEFGFTSKNGARGGMGLHWCANAIAQVGGKISAESDGVGKGAVFHLDIPGA